MKKSRIYILGMTTLIAALATCVATATADERTGTWKMNAAKSKYSPGPALQNLTETIASDENSFKVDVNGTDGDGKPMHIKFNGKFDGKDYLISGVPWADMVSVKRVDAHTAADDTKEGKPRHDNHNLQGFHG